MIGYIRGQVLECAEGRALVAVGAPDGSSALGYSLAVPQSPSYLSIVPGTPIELYVYTHVREDALDLFGFRTRPEKELFLILLSVNGVGPKVAMGLLAGAEPESIVQAILDGDTSFLTRIPGIGKKIAERIVLELGDSLRKKVESGFFARSRASRAQVAAARASAPAGAQALVHDAREALVGLGYREAEVSTLLNRVVS
ncbi:MAG TPA: Holliday junction branch migration protein RuvA, partial [Bdellovibrionota bacterium]|nr:Holliday junction branch migration protein RuvA [Bdellovibrionota bacterium]